MKRFVTRKGFTLVELLIVFFLMVMIYIAAWYSFIHSYGQVKKGTEKMYNIHAVAIVLEMLRHEITALPSMAQMEDAFVKGQDLDYIQYTRSEYGSQKEDQIRYHLDKEEKQVVRTVNGVTQVYGRGRILEFNFNHNINMDKPNFPTWIKVHVKTVDDHASEVTLDATIYPRLINRNIQLEQNL